MFVHCGKTGDEMKVTEKRRSRYPGEIWTTSLTMTVEKKVIILGTTTA